MATEIEEVVVYAKLFDFQKALPDSGECLLSDGARRNVFGPFLFGRRQCFAIDLAVRQ